MTRKKLLINAICLLTLSVCLFFVSTFTGVKKTQAQVEKPVDLFSQGGLTAKGNSSLPQQFSDFEGNKVACDFDNGRKGVLLTGKRSGGETTLNTTFRGDFEVEFRAYSKVSYHPESADDYNRHDIQVTPYANLKEMYFYFEDENGKSFKVIISAGEAWNVITPSARVNINGINAGLHYLNDDKVPTDTSLKNASGFYTRMGGTTFCNVARRGNAYTSAKSMPVKMGYDASTMEVYVYHYGTRAELEGERRVVLDLDDYKTNANAFDSFGDYKVTIGFSDIVGGEANALIYSINGENLGEENFEDNIAGTTYVQPQFNGIKGEKYILPKPSSFHIKNGITKFDGTVKVYKNSQIKTYHKNGSEITDDSYEDDCYFIPDSSGKYKITYNTKLKNGTKGKDFTVEINVFDKMPQMDYKINGNYRQIEESGEIAKGTILTIYSATVSSLYFVKQGDKECLVTLKKDGQIYRDLNNKEDFENTEIVFDETGNYEIIYSVKGEENQKYSKTIKFKVTDELPLFEIDKHFERVGFGMQIDVPKVTATLKGAKKRATISMYAPDGTRLVDEDGKYLLNQVGTYTLKSTAIYNGKPYNYNYYYECMQTNENLFSGSTTGVRYEYGDSGKVFNKQLNGTKMVFTAENEEITCERVINLKTATKDKPLVKLTVLPEVNGELDMWQFTIKLTDVKDKNSFVNIHVFKGSWGNAFSYVKAGANGQVSAGWEMDKVLVDYNTGCPIKFSFTGEAISQTEECALYYDYEEKAIYVDNIKRPGYSYGNLVIDLDDPKCFSEKTLFKGFTSDEVKMSFSVQYMQKSSATLLVTEICGIGVGDNFIKDNDPPSIIVDYKGYEQPPLGEVGTKYPIFDCSAIDVLCGYVNCNVEVFKDYQLSTAKKYEVVNNKFTPDKSGKYTIVYSALDASGNKSEKIVEVNVVDKLDPYKLSRNILDKTYYLGDDYDFTSVDVTGGSGRASVKVTLSKDGKEVEGSRFKEMGSYTLKVECNDFLGRKEVTEQKFDVMPDDKPVIYDVNLPKAIINDYEYILPDFEAVSYDENGKEIAVEKSVYVETSKGNVEIKNGKFKPNLKGGEKVKVVYKAVDKKSRVSTKTFVVDVLDVKKNNGIDMQKFFSLKNVTTTADRKSVEFTAVGDNSIDFVNAVIANNLELEFVVPKEKNNFKSFTITLTDSLDKNIKVSVKVVKGGKDSGKSIVVIDGKKYQIAGDFFGTTTHGIAFGFNNSKLYFRDVYGMEILGRVEKTDKGSDFNGFPSKKVYLTFTIDEIEGESSLQLVRIGNQYFSSLAMDRVPPQIDIQGAVNMSGKINQRFTIPYAVGSDVLNPETEISMTLKYDKDIIYQGSIDKDFVFTPDKYGRYSVTYMVNEPGKRSETLSFSFVIKDEIAPEIKIDGDVPNSAEKGKNIKLPNAVASDNYSENLSVKIFVTSPKGVISLAQENSFVPEEKGKYKISYYVSDGYSNYCYKTFYVEVR